MGTAREALDVALMTMAADGQRPPCGDADQTHLWTSEKAHERARAAVLCGPCPLLDICHQSAIEEDDQWTVRGGLDLRPSPEARRDRKAS